MVRMEMAGVLYRGFLKKRNIGILRGQMKLSVKARLHRRFLSQQLNATQCNFCLTEVANSCDFIAILVQFVNVNVSTRLLLKQKLCAC